MNCESVIRKGCQDDIEAMALLLEELFTIEKDFSIDIEKQKKGLRLILEDSEAVVLVAAIENQVVGMASVQRLVSTATGEYVGLIEDVVVAQNYRSLGLGSKLIQAIIHEADIRGWGRLALGADRRNEKAISFYEKYGFTLSNMGLMYKKSPFVLLCFFTIDTLLSCLYYVV